MIGVTFFLRKVTNSIYIFVLLIDAMNQDRGKHQPKTDRQLQKCEKQPQASKGFWDTVMTPEHSAKQSKTSTSVTASSEKGKQRKDTETKDSVLFGGGKPRFTCEYCHKKTFERKGHLESHIDSVHYGRKLHVCQGCEKRYGHRSSLQRHVRQVHGNSEHPNFHKTTSEMWNKIAFVWTGSEFIISKWLIFIANWNCWKELTSVLSWFSSSQVAD